MNYRDILNVLKERTGEDQGDTIRIFLRTIKEEVKRGGEVQLYGFGKFSKKTMKARIGFNPRTLKKMEIKESSRLFFKQTSSLRGKI